MRPRILDADQISALLPELDLIEPISAGFAAYSRGQAVVPPPGELSFDEPRGDVHIKYGHIAGDDEYVIKVASGFYNNPALGLPVGDGLMLVFGRATGQLRAVLLDGGLLTRVRTGIAGAIAARHLSPPEVTRIGVIGAGNQARWQVRSLAAVSSCREILAFSEPDDDIGAYRREMQADGFSVQRAESADEVAARCELIVTTTPARSPVLRAGSVRPGTHITAVGADTPGKQELETDLLGRADLVVADSYAQAIVRGECAHAVAAGVLDSERIVELGAVISGDAAGRTSADQITIADLTGVAVQDIAIARAVLSAAGS